MVSGQIRFPKNDWLRSSAGFVPLFFSALLSYPTFTYADDSVPNISTANENAQLQSTYLSSSDRTDALLYANEKATFYENGKLKTAILQAGSKLNSNVLPLETTVQFDENGKPQTITLNYDDPQVNHWDYPKFDFGGLSLSVNIQIDIH